MTVEASELTTPVRLEWLASSRGADTAIQIVPGGGRLTFQEWHDRSTAVAQGLVELGVRPGDRILLLASSDWIAYAIAYVATHRAGATAVPVLATHGEDHLRWALRATDAVGVIGDRTVDDGKAWAAAISVLERGRPEQVRDIAVSPDDDAEVIFTSGTTGRPKGVAATHRNLLSALHSGRPGAAKTVLHAIPPATNAGQGLLLQALSDSPHRILVMPRFSPEDFLTAIQEWAPTDIVLVPAMALALLRADRAADRDLSSVRMVRTMSAPISPASLERLDAMFPNASIINMYASTESWPARIRTRFDPSRPGSVGRPEGRTQVRVVGPGGGELAAGTVGEIQMRADGVPPRRYLNDPPASAAVFLPDGWIRTGDLGYLDADGYLYVRDRKGDVVISGGLNISTLEVAAMLEAHPHVIEAAAFGMPHAVLGAYVAAAVRADPALDVADLYAYARARLGPAKAPRRILIVDELPRTPMGKVIKDSLPDLLGTRTTGASVHRRRVGSPEQITQIWTDVLKRSVSYTDDFLDLGGTSLEAGEITVRVRRELGKAVREEDIYRTGTLAEYVKATEAAPATDSAVESPIMRLPRGAG